MNKHIDLDLCINDPLLPSTLAELHLDTCDALIVSDGSGTTWAKSCGWAATFLDLHSRERKHLYGAMNFGTSYLAELIPYVHALSWYIEGPGRERLTTKMRLRASSVVRIGAITDSELLSKQGAGLASRKTGNYYWAMIEAVAERGFLLEWRWVPRSVLGLNRLADHLAGTCRKSMDIVAGVTLPGLTDTFTETDSATAVQGDPP